VVIVEHNLEFITIYRNASLSTILSDVSRSLAHFSY